MSAASNSEDRWLDSLLSAPPAALPDGGFTARVMTRIRLRRLFRPLVLTGLGILGASIALRFASLEAMAALLPTEKIAQVLDALPEISILPTSDSLPTLPALPAIGAVDFTSPVALAMIAVVFLTWLIQETA